MANWLNKANFDIPAQLQSAIDGVGFLEEVKNAIAPEVISDDEIVEVIKKTGVACCRLLWSSNSSFNSLVYDEISELLSKASALLDNPMQDRYLKYCAGIILEAAKLLGIEPSNENTYRETYNQTLNLVKEGNPDLQEGYQHFITGAVLRVSGVPGGRAARYYFAEDFKQNQGSYGSPFKQPEPVLDNAGKEIIKAAPTLWLTAVRTVTELVPLIVTYILKLRNKNLKLGLYLYVFNQRFLAVSRTDGTLNYLKNLDSALDGVLVMGGTPQDCIAFGIDTKYKVEKCWRFLVGRSPTEMLGGELLAPPLFAKFGMTWLKNPIADEEPQDSAGI